MAQHDHSHSHGGEATAGGKGQGEYSGGMTCCAHHEIAKIDKLIPLYLVGGVLVLVSLFSRWLGHTGGGIADIPALIGAIMLSIPLFWAAFREVKAMSPSSSTLVAIGILAAMATGDYRTAGLLAFVLLIADQILRRTAFGAQRAIEQLVNLTPDRARIVVDGSEQEVELSDVKVGQTVRVRPGENLPVDGRVATGRSTINQASLTGEAMPVEVQPGDLVYAGTTNLTGQVDVLVTQVGGETTIGKVTTLIREAEETRTPRQLLIEQVARFFVPIALSVAAVVWFINSQSGEEAARVEAAKRAITVLIVACPASLLLASPTAMVAAFASAARLGVMVKQSHYLEAAANVDAVVMDKTGTITTGKFEVSRLVPAEGVEGAELLKAAANAEQHSNHPLAQSILRTATAAKIQVDGSDDYEEIHGRGVRARTTMGELCVGRAKWLIELNPAIRPAVEAIEAKIEGMSGVHVMRNGQYLGVVGLEDKVRPNTKAVISRLRELGVRMVAIFTGDRLSVAKRVGASVGVDAIEAECHPEEKHQQIRQLVGQGYRTMMIGDGINDGPSLAAADVGVAMGLSGSDIATNSAGIALMTDDLSRVPFLIELSRKTRQIIGMNIAASILIVLVGLVLASAGWLAIPAAALYHFVGEVFVLANSFRLFRFGENFAAAEEAANKPTATRREASLRGLGVAQA
ncbi:MAG: cation-translocating P-type ATPase [Phycisphaeraceae bacterium]|nr:cation-translocating P-type ATPase [Phycisphaeraceae bacterium]MCW5755527.1 cation-translocating P-type ATPase [Phycisphaeraceae bacterium]